MVIVLLIGHAGKGEAIILIIWIAIVTIGLNASYFLRNHTRWARASTDFLKGLARRKDDGLVLAWSVFSDVALIVVVGLFILGRY